MTLDIEESFPNPDFPSPEATDLQGKSLHNDEETTSQFNALLEKLKQGQDELTQISKKQDALSERYSKGFNHPVGSTPALDLFRLKGACSYSQLSTAKKIAELAPDKAIGLGLPIIFEAFQHDAEGLDLTVSGLGWLLEREAVEMLISISSESTIYFSIAKTGDSFLYRAVPSSYFLDKQRWVGADHNGVGGYLEKHTAEGNGHITDIVRGGFRGILGHKETPSGWKAYLKLNAPIEPEQKESFCRARDIPLEDFEESAASDYVNILKRLSGVVDPSETTLIIDPQMGPILSRSGNPIPNNINFASLLEYLDQEGVSPELSPSQQVLPSATSKNDTEIERFVQVAGEHGLHTLNARAIAEKCNEYPKAEIKLILNEQEASGRIIMEMFLLNAGCEAKILLRSSGDKAQQALEAVSDILSSKQSK